MHQSNTPLNAYTPYQLPDYYNVEEASTLYRIFLFKDWGEADAEKIASEVVKRDYIKKVIVLCEEGNSAEKLQRYADILEKSVPSERGIEIEYQRNLQTDFMYNFFQTMRVEIVMGRALLN